MSKFNKKEKSSKRNNVAYGMILAEMGKSAGFMRDRRERRSKEDKRSFLKEEW